MTFKVAVGAGHGGNGSTPGKRTPDNEYEWNFNDRVVDAFIKELNNYEGVSIKRMDDASGKTDIPLRTRTDSANSWGADIYVSFHHNANTGRWGNWTGTETFYSKGSTKGKQLASLLHKANVKAYRLRDRGLKTNNLHITRETTMPAVLVEGGFMDSTIDIKKMRNNTVLADAGKYSARAVAEYAGLMRKQTNLSESIELYRVRKSWADTSSQKGAFENLSNAKDLANKFGYNVYDSDGKKVYSGGKAKATPKASLKVDGYWGAATTKALQKVLGTPVDGVISGQYRNNVTSQLTGIKYGSPHTGSLAIKELQRKIGATEDGYFGPETLRKLQRYLGTPVDGVLSRPSLMVKELQRRLNAGTF